MNAAGVNVEAFWPKLYAKALEGRNVADFFAVSGDDSHVAPVVAAPAAASKDKEAVKKDDST